jgi:hypothetical protein
MSEPPVAPDDTPTRLQRLLFEAGDDEVGPACSRVEVPPTLVMDPAFREPYVQGYRHALWDARMAEKAEVSRLREEMAPLYNTEQWLRWCDIRVLERAEAAEAEVSRLQQENALFRRSLEMLTKQLDEKDERIVELETLTQM